VLIRACVAGSPAAPSRASDPFYIRRDADERVAEIADSTGETLIKAPRQMGKTSLLNRYIDECHQLGKRWVFVDFQSFTDADLDNYLALLGRLAAGFLRGLDLGGEVETPTFISQQQFSFSSKIASSDGLVAPSSSPSTRSTAFSDDLTSPIFSAYCASGTTTAPSPYRFGSSLTSPW
jgi:AAA-like domain